MSAATRPIRAPELAAPLPPAIPEPARPNVRRWVIIGLVAAAIVGGLWWAVPLLSYSKSHESTDNAQVDGHIIPVLAKVGGYVTRVTATDNQHVAEGALLIQIDPTELAERLAQANADLAGAAASAGSRSETGGAEAMVESAANQRAATESQIIAARAKETKALADLRRFEGLAERRVVSQQQLESARAAAEAATAERQSLELQSRAAGNNVSTMQAGVRLAVARLAAARAARDAAALQLSYTTIKAPAAGLVSKRQIEVGQLVQPGQPILSIVADTGVYVTANLKETQLGRVRPGQQVDLDVDAYGDCKAEGRVESIAAATGAKFSLIPPENATGNFTKVVQRVPVRIAVTKGCGTGEPLRPGISIEAHVRVR
jgi:membrane fusion protein (multidrug efflux system)